MDPTYLQRLSFIKYLFSIGLYQSYQPEPLYGVSILSFHDSVELFLELSSEKLDIGGKDKRFMEYWDIINNKINEKILTQKESMRRLNKARVNLKHHGIIPSKLDIETFRAITQNFFNENSPTIFNINFDNISLIDLIKFERPRESLKKAKNAFEKNLIKDSLMNLALSFEYLILDYQEAIKGKYYRSPFFFGNSMTFHKGISLDPDYKNRELRAFADTVAESIEAIQKAIKILSFGLDYKKFVKYDSIIPYVWFAGDGTPHFTLSENITLDKDDLDFCINFIVESSLKLQEFEFEINK